MKNPLWTKNFTIITLGTVVSTMGNMVAGFAMGLMVLDYTDSTFLYALFMVCYSLPRVIVPLLAGPYLDRFSRKKVIYTLDFFSAAIFACMAAALFSGFFNYWVYLAGSILVGSIDSVYQVAYESLYPNLISQGNFDKAYSISSLMYPLATVAVVPLAIVCYNTIGLAPLFAFDAVTFFAAAVMETRIDAPEGHIAPKTAPMTARAYLEDFKEGIRYIKSQKGLMVITAYFFFTMLCGSATGTLQLPYFKSVPTLGVMAYALVMAANVGGRLIGGVAHYRFKYPTAKKTAIAIMVYLVISGLEGAYLFFPLTVMILMQLAHGMFSVTSYNIRIAGTQGYVPDEKRGRFNGVFLMLTTAGEVLGKLLGGALGEAFDMRLVVAGFMAVNVVCALVIMAANRNSVKPIYNR